MTGATRRTKEELIDALDAAMITLREFAKDKSVTIEEVFAIAQRDLGIERWNFDDIFTTLQQTGIFGGTQNDLS